MVWAHNTSLIHKLLTSTASMTTMPIADRHPYSSENLALVPYRRPSSSNSTNRPKACKTHAKRALGATLLFLGILLVHDYVAVRYVHHRVLQLNRDDISEYAQILQVIIPP